MRSARAHVRTRFAAQVALTDRRSALKTRVLKEDEMRLRGWLCVLCVTSLTFLAGCNGGAGLAPSGPVQDGSSSALRAPAVADMSGPESTLSDGSPSRIIRQRFAHPKTPPDEWAWSGTACLTAGNKNTPTTSIPACGASAKKNQSGWGVLQLTTADSFQVSLVGYHKPFPTSRGLRIRWNLYSFDGSGADGTLLWMSYANKPQPTQPAGTGGHLGYLNGMATAGGAPPAGMPHVYLGIGFDEYGNFSAFLPGGPGLVPNTVAVGGAAKIGYEYLTGVENASGEPISLPFPLAQPALTLRPAPISVQVILKSGGLLQVGFDIHDGNGYVTYISKKIVGIAGQPKVPKNVWIGFNASTGGSADRHQIDDVRVARLN
jgi:hypothetical protein